MHQGSRVSHPSGSPSCTGFGGSVSTSAAQTTPGGCDMAAVAGEDASPPRTPVPGHFARCRTHHRIDCSPSGCTGGRTSAGRRTLASLPARRAAMPGRARCTAGRPGLRPRPGQGIGHLGFLAITAGPRGGRRTDESWCTGGSVGALVGPSDGAGLSMDNPAPLRPGRRGGPPTLRTPAPRGPRAGFGHVPRSSPPAVKPLLGG